MIAGETSLAYDEVVTMNIVSSRAIGIGAYLVRLGQRTVQLESSNIILTGFQALNKVLGSDVYTSNNQLGGVQIMANNGVTHDVVETDVQAVKVILKWLSFIPKAKGSLLPIMMSADPVDRPVEFTPTEKTPYDPRWLIEGELHQVSRNSARDSDVTRILHAFQANN